MEATKVNNPTEIQTPVQKALEKILRDIDSYSDKEIMKSVIELDLLTLAHESKMDGFTQAQRICTETIKNYEPGTVPPAEDLDNDLDYGEEERYDVKDSDLELLGNSYSENDC